MKIAAYALAGLLGLAACASDAPADPTTPLMDDGPDQCKAAEAQRFVGMKRSQLPTAPAGAVWRVTCTTCPVTMDYNPARLNIVYDSATDVVKEVKCG